MHTPDLQRLMGAMLIDDSSIDEIINGSEADENRDNRTHGTTLRMTPVSHRFFSHHASRLEISWQTMVSTALHAMAMEALSPPTAALELARTRILRTLDLHKMPNVALPAAVNAFGDTGFSLADFDGGSPVVESIHPDALNTLARLFGVSTAWLMGERVPSGQFLHPRDFDSIEALIAIAAAREDWFSKASEDLTVTTSELIRVAHAGDDAGAPWLYYLATQFSIASFDIRTYLPLGAIHSTAENRSELASEIEASFERRGTHCSTVNVPSYAAFALYDGEMAAEVFRDCGA